MKVFITGFIQVVLVGLNTWMLSHEQYAGAFICGFLISLFWCMNVKRVAFGSWKEKLIYCTGAAFGSLSSLLIVKVIYK